MISSRGAHHKPVLYVALLVETTRYHFGGAGLAHLSSPSEFGAQISPRKLPSVGTNNWRGRQVTKEMGLCKERHLSAREILLARVVSRGGRAIRQIRQVRVDGCVLRAACCVQKGTPGERGWSGALVWVAVQSACEGAGTRPAAVGPERTPVEFPSDIMF